MARRSSLHAPRKCITRSRESPLLRFLCQPSGQDLDSLRQGQYGFGNLARAVIFCEVIAALCQMASGGGSPFDVFKNFPLSLVHCFELSLQGVAESILDCLPPTF